MRQVNVSVHVLVVLGVMLCSQWLTARQAHAQNCVNVLALADNTMLGVIFTRNGFTFQSRGGLIPVVNVFIDIDGDPVHGVQFSDQGLEVMLPAPSNAVDIAMGVFTTPRVRVRAFNALGGIEAGVLVPADDQLHNSTLTTAGSPIVRLRFTGGGNEGIINEICSN